MAAPDIVADKIYTQHFGWKQKSLIFISLIA
jgi:hypothetical protein